MNDIQRIYDLIAKGQACTVDAIVLATGLDLVTVRARVAWLRMSGRIARGQDYRPARYYALIESEPPKAYRARKAKEKQIRAKAPDSGFMALNSALGGWHG